MKNESTRVVVLAAGKGKRMGLDIPKVLVPINGQPMLGLILEAVQNSNIDSKPIVIFGHGVEQICEFVKGRAECVLQKEQLGTADAVKSARDTSQQADNIFVLNGDHPLVRAKSLQKIADQHISNGVPITMGVGVAPDFNDWRSVFSHFGRILRDGEGNLLAIREYKDATDKEREIKEINPAYYCFDAKWLWENIDKITPQNAQDEYYLTDLIEMALGQGLKVKTVEIPLEECVGVNTQEDRDLAESILKI